MEALSDAVNQQQNQAEGPSLQGSLKDTANRKETKAKRVVEKREEMASKLKFKDDQILALEGEIEHMKNQHHVAMKKLEAEAQEARRARAQLRGCQDELERVRKSLEMLQARRKEREPQIKIGKEENVENGKKELEEELKQAKFQWNCAKMRADDLLSLLEYERRARKQEKSAHYHKKMKWNADKEGYEQMAENFLDDMREEADLVKSLKKERDILRRERDAEKKAKEELLDAFRQMDENAKRLKKELTTAEEEKQTKENVWKAEKEALEAQVREAQACMKRIQDLAQQFPRTQGLKIYLYFIFF
ncbi:hypothetical protein L3Y34_019332 [Caenorhabditis briggsae]|uniref:Uncharacterized protein n=1 Tax=Caenorhabditis briggsae TaxID=6238 RepID=A0AAE9DPL8_CAEBR|nr:hypothetical protein L3Y34_019332 [Caenorhabditis briggsae]